MRKFGKKDIGRLLGVLHILVVFLLTGCGSSGIGDSDYHIIEYGFDLDYKGKPGLERIKLKTDDLDEIVDLYQEIGNGIEYRDSLLIAEKYAKGLGANAFAQDNLDTLVNQGLTLSEVKKTQIGLRKYGKKINAVLVEYEITEGLIDNVPLLYVSQLFIPNDKNMVLMSFISENKSSYLNASDMFKNIK